MQYYFLDICRAYSDANNRYTVPLLPCSQAGEYQKNDNNNLEEMIKKHGCLLAANISITISLPKRADASRKLFIHASGLKRTIERFKPAILKINTAKEEKFFTGSGV
jgi:hypothetical protein